MRRFRTTLVAGGKPPCTSGTFLSIPAELAAERGAGQVAVRETVAGTTFRSTASRGEGKLRSAIPRELRERTGNSVGDAVEGAIELGTNPPPLRVPDEIRASLNDHREAGRLCDVLPPSLRRAWAAYVGEAQQPETRIRRARKVPSSIRAREFPR